MELAELNPNLIYTYADYLKWTFQERVELLKGKIYAMSAPSREHQDLSSFIQGELYDYLKGKNCKVYAAPFDVRIPRKLKEDTDIITVLQPDICVICNKSILDAKGCLGAPDIVVEILSPSDSVTELSNKYDIYLEAGVKEYWVVSPQNKTFLMYTLQDGKYMPSRLMVAGHTATSTVLNGFSLDLTALFNSMD